MKNYIERLNITIKERKSQNISIDDITCLYSDFKTRKIDRFNYIYRVKLYPFLKMQYKKRVKKENFNRKLFSKILFNNLYSIRQYKDDSCFSTWNKESDIYKYYASHQYIRRELEHMTIDDIIFLSYSLCKDIK